MSSTLKLGVLFVAIYGVLVLLNAGFYAWWSTDYSGLSRAILRVGGVALVIYGLINKANWAWWLAIIGTGCLCILGGMATVILLSNDLFASRPYATTDMVFMLLSVGVLALALITLLLPGSRKEIIRTKKV